MSSIGVPLVMASDSPCATVKVTSVATNGASAPPEGLPAQSPPLQIE